MGRRKNAKQRRLDRRHDDVGWEPTESIDPDDSSSDRDVLAFDECMAETVAIIQRDWDETTHFLRSLGITSTPNDVTAKAYVGKLQRELSHNIPQYARIFAVDRERFEWSAWLRIDDRLRSFWDECTPDEIRYDKDRKRPEFHFTLKTRRPQEDVAERWWKVYRRQVPEIC